MNGVDGGSDTCAISTLSPRLFRASCRVLSYVLRHKSLMVVIKHVAVGREKAPDVVHDIESCSIRIAIYPITLDTVAVTGFVGSCRICSQLRPTRPSHVYHRAQLKHDYVSSYPSRTSSNGSSCCEHDYEVEIATMALPCRQKQALSGPRVFVILWRVGGPSVFNDGPFDHELASSTPLPVGAV